MSIMASAFFGSISGSSISNVLTTGAITIPTMKRTGYPAYYAGAIEAASSTGGVLMPPIMGVTAFVMAEFLAMPYYAICIAAIVPSLLYFGGLFLQTDAYAARANLKGLSREELPSVKKTLTAGWFYTIGMLFFCLGVTMGFHVPPLRNGGFIPPERQGQYPARVREALETLNGYEAVYLF
jgi:TRAP-type uncharacterized transport system fused permease subunit